MAGLIERLEAALVGIDSDASHRSARVLVDEAESERDAANAQARAATVACGLRCGG